MTAQVSLEDVKPIAQWVGTVVDFAGVAIIVLGIVSATALLLHQITRGVRLIDGYPGHRRNTGRAIGLALRVPPP